MQEEYGVRDRMEGRRGEGIFLAVSMLQLQMTQLHKIRTFRMHSSRLSSRLSFSSLFSLLVSRLVFSHLYGRARGKESLADRPLLLQGARHRRHAHDATPALPRASPEEREECLGDPSCPVVVDRQRVGGLLRKGRLVGHLKREPLCVVQ